MSEVKSLAKDLSAFDTVKDYKNFVLSYTVGKKGQVGAVLVFNKNNGEFSYKATDGVPLAAGAASTNEKIYAFLKKIGWYDPTLKVIAHYKLRNDAETTYYEIKRDWEATGMPILNPIGLLNVDDNKSFANLQLNDSSTSVGINSDIYNTSDDKDGIARNSDFNTMTIGISDRTNNIIAVKSNIRKREDNETKNMAIIPYDKAISMLKKNDQALILTTPANVTNVDEWQKIYPNQIAEAKEAIVTESTLAYLEQSPISSQKKLEPFYIFRGKATLTNAYQINFIAAVPAVNTSQARTFPSVSFSLIPQVYAVAGDLNNQIGQIGQQKQGSFDLLQTPTPPPSPTPAYRSCIPAAADLNPYNTQSSANGIIGYGWSPVAVINGKIQMSRKGWWYFVPAENTTDATLRNDLNQILIAIQQYTGQQMDFRDFNTGISIDFQDTGTACPIRVTGDSPSIFVYAPEGEHIIIQPPTFITYAEPLLVNKQWSLIANGKGKFHINDKLKDYLYYEYASVDFRRPKEGWLVNQKDITLFVENTIRPKLHLNTPETKRLIYELTHASSKINYENIFIGLINKDELDEKLPLAVTPKLDTYRYIFYIGKPGAEKVRAPHIDSIRRVDSMLVELGSFAEK